MTFEEMPLLLHRAGKIESNGLRGANVKKTLLFINGCIRENSRTEALCRRYLAGLTPEYQVEEVKTVQLDLPPLNGAALAQRDADLRQDHLDGQSYALARQFAAADRILIAAPYWDCLFPAALRLYLEHICVAGITFSYGEEGAMIKTCRADRMTYVTTCGGFLSKPSAVECLVREMGKLFSIADVRFYAAEGLDVFPEQVPAALSRILEKMQAE